ncbi:MAG: hypothetical protein DRN95_04115, partial [Candidatus Hydrothermarchaeota archaeon]
RQGRHGEVEDIVLRLRSLPGVLQEEALEDELYHLPEGHFGQGPGRISVGGDRREGLHHP